jgi:nucleotidyltransferase substrate binding protein (TIGR01987 family)
MRLSTAQYARCIETLEASLTLLRQAEPESVEYEIFRNAVIKGFELTLETAGKLLRKTLQAYIANPRAVAALSYKEVLRDAASHGLLSAEAGTRWFAYRDNRHSEAHDYGAVFTEETLKLLPRFIEDAHALEDVLRKELSDVKA